MKVPSTKPTQSVSVSDMDKIALAYKCALVCIKLLLRFLLRIFSRKSSKFPTPSQKILIKSGTWRPKRSRSSGHGDGEPNLHRIPHVTISGEILHLSPLTFFPFGQPTALKTRIISFFSCFNSSRHRMQLICRNCSSISTARIASVSFLILRSSDLSFIQRCSDIHKAERRLERPLRTDTRIHFFYRRRVGSLL